VEEAHGSGIEAGAILGKAIVQAMAVISGAFFGFLGYRLYLQGVESATEATFAWGSIEFWMAGGGPGIFFALAGVLVIYVAVTHRLIVEIKADQIGPEAQGGRRSSNKRKIGRKE